MNLKQFFVIMCLVAFLVPIRSICLAQDWSAKTATPVRRLSGVIRPCMNQRDLEAQMLSAINRARSFARRCGSRRCPKAGPVIWSRKLALAARIHSEDMAIYNRFSHRGSDNSSMGDRLAAAGYRPRAWGENLAAGQKGVSEAVRAWVQSPPHCSNIMLPDFTEIGGSCVMGRNGRRYWTLMLAAPLLSENAF